jgi:hypothetical protein
MNGAMALRGHMPSHTRFALVLLWVAWLISVCAWIVHLYEVRGPTADLYSVAGLPAVITQGVLIYFIGRGSNLARLLVLLAAIPALIVVQVFFSAQFNLSPLRLWVEAALRGAAIALLLTPQSTRWFKRARVAE